MPILEVKDLSAGYGNGPVIRDVAFSLEQGEFVTILGRNGSGKSTLIKGLQKLIPDVSGVVRVSGQELSGMGRRPIARRIAYVPQLYDPVFEFRVIEIILMGRYIHQNRLTSLSTADSEILEDVLNLTQIRHLAHKKMAHLSGGERQRVFMARALVQDTPLLFLDEPSSHLDVCYQIEIYDILRRLQKEKNKTILAAEHNINLAVLYSQRIIFLKDGRISGQGPPRELITKDNIKFIFNADVDVRENARTGLPEVSLIAGAAGES